MNYHEATDISMFFVAGINYKKTDACVRGKFAVNNDQYELILAHAASLGIKEVFVLSTCNRTEIYGFASDPKLLISILCAHTEGSVEQFLEKAYVKVGVPAIEHIFNVAAGLDSQILGDYEIIWQIKQSVKFSKNRNLIGAYLERMINEVLEASKKIRTNTSLSSGTVSVSFAAVQCIKQNYTELKGKHILLIGTGKIGSNACKNIADYLPGATVTLVNRTAEKAKALSFAFCFNYDHIENLENCIAAADIILVATTCTEPVVLLKHFNSTDKKLVIDLSMPYNVAHDVNCLTNVEVVRIDELSKIKDETLLKRTAEIPKVKAIITNQVLEFLDWHEMRQHVPLFKAVKRKLLSLNTDNSFEHLLLSAEGCQKSLNEQRIQKVINGMAIKVRTQNQKGCHYIEAINDFISTATYQ